MSGKLKKADKKYILSDSTVNCYGFRLLTDGYQIEEYARNPIGYYMHQREGGVLVRWEDLCADGDIITGYPVINLSNERGEQTVEEIESGFLNAASMGHIVVLEWSMEPSLMLPGQTGPTITKWYNKECSLVDVPGNSNAVAALYDAGNIPITLADLASSRNTKPVSGTISGIEGGTGLSAASIEALQILGAATSTDINVAIAALANKAAVAEANLATLRQTNANREVDTLLEKALDDRKITMQLKATLARDYVGKPAELTELLEGLPRYVGIVELLHSDSNNIESKWTWADYEQNDPTGIKLASLRARDVGRYKELYEQRFKTTQE